MLLLCRSSPSGSRCFALRCNDNVMRSFSCRRPLCAWQHQWGLKLGRGHDWLDARFDFAIDARPAFRPITVIRSVGITFSTTRAGTGSWNSKIPYQLAPGASICRCQATLKVDFWFAIGDAIHTCMTPRIWLVSGHSNIEDTCR